MASEFWILAGARSVKSTIHIKLSTLLPKLEMKARLFKNTRVVLPIQETVLKALKSGHKIGSSAPVNRTSGFQAEADVFNSLGIPFFAAEKRHTLMFPAV